MRVRDLWARHGIALTLAFDAVVIGVYWYVIPMLKRPLEGLMVVLTVLGIVTTVAARSRKWLPGASMIVVSIAVAILCVEMAEKFFHVTSFFENKPSMRVGEGGKYAWDIFTPATYISAKDAALNDGIDPEALKDDFAGDVFERLGIEKLRVRRQTRGDRTEVLECASEESPWLRDPPLGSELRPGNMFRTYCRDEDTERMLYDGVCNTGPYGFRMTKGDDGADETFVFMGCSFTFGMNLSDHQTLPSYFSGRQGFRKRVINLGVGGNGPHHSLRDLELNYRLGRAGVKNAEVKAVIFSYLDIHQPRVTSPTPELSPRYVLENGRAVYKGTFSDTGELGRLRILLLRSRIFPVIMKKLSGGRNEFELTMAILEEMHRICGERYGIPLTVVYWDDDSATLARLESMGVRLVRVSGAFEKNWREMSIKYLLFDGHPAAYANSRLAEHLFAVLEKG